jgi:succinate dehydrogenase / fumarate reductase, cytochrome b subunit
MENKNNHHVINRPKFLNLFILAKHMAMPAKVSILHRVSGVLLVITIPLLIFILHQSLISPNFYLDTHNFLSHPIIKIFFILLVWALLHHICAGIRFLLLDIDLGVAIKSARTSAKIVLAFSIILTIIFGITIW